jgi:hypothetical protein
MGEQPATEKLSRRLRTKKETKKTNDYIEETGLEK